MNLIVDSQSSLGLPFTYDDAVILGVTPPQGRTDGGSPATVLTLTGTGFSASGYVTVGGVQATTVTYADTYVEGTAVSAGLGRSLAHAS